MQKYSRILHRLLAVYILAVWVVIIFGLISMVQDEIRSSKHQAYYLSKITRELGFRLNPGYSSSIRYPQTGPYDLRMGYVQMPDQIQHLINAGFTISAQAASSPMMNRLVDEYGLTPIYHEKAQAGLKITDRADQLIFNTAYPADGYPSFETIPPVILNTLLFIENRELLNKNNITVNPAIEWDRLGFAVMQMIANKLGIIDNVPGGSTLATQIEKYRHSPNGYTNSLKDKFKQMLAASIRAYLLGPDTRAMRKEIALSYLNSMPLAATAQQGEIHGLGDGVTAWFGANFTQVNQLLSAEALKSPAISPAQAQAYRQVLSILLSQRRPSYLLGRGYTFLQSLTDSYLRLLYDQGVISEALRDAALNVAIKRTAPPSAVEPQFVTEKKTLSVLRTRLAKLLGVKSSYELDRTDLTVKTSLDYQTQQAVTEALHSLTQTDVAIKAGLVGDKRLLNSNVDMSPIIYSLMLFERSDTGNLLRIQADNYDQPLDINEGIRIDLGSTAKLRTMVHYLELVTDVYQLYQGRDPNELAKLEIHPRDYLSAWVIDQLKANPDIQLEDLLNNALDKRYSASPGEYFYTGGGLHHFNNFTKDEDYKIMSVRDALRDSVNLVFVRLMRDITYHHLYKPEGIARWLENPDDDRRNEYLQKFADEEGMVYMRRFYAKYKDKTADEILNLLSAKVFHKATRLTMLYQAIYPDADYLALKKYLKKQLPGNTLSDSEIWDLSEKYTVKKFDLQDQGFITKVHPLELWLARYMAEHPKAGKKKVFKDSAAARQEVYRWLFSSHRKVAQQRRIMTLLEAEAFNQIHKAWKRVGYPFEALTPSYATSIGASGDRPAALAELVGILLNDGVRLPTVRFEQLHYAQDTPYETILDKMPTAGQSVFAPEIARVARGAMMGVVAGGTAVRLNHVYTDPDGKYLTVGGKTGTGDHRKQIWGKGGRLIESKFISRAATFTFFLGDHFFGVITAYVQGEESEKYHFTSALPVQIVKFLKPILEPMINKAALAQQTPKPESDVAPASDAVPAAAPQFEATPDSAPATESRAPDQSAPASEPDVATEPESISKPETIPEPSETEAVPASEVAPKPVRKPAITRDQFPRFEPEPKPTPVPKVDSEPVLVPEPVPAPRVRNELKPLSTPAPVRDTEPVIESAPVTEPVPKLAPAPVRNEIKPITTPQPMRNTWPAIKSKSAPETESAPVSKITPVPTPVGDDIKPVAKPKTKPADKRGYYVPPGFGTAPASDTEIKVRPLPESAPAPEFNAKPKSATNLAPVINAEPVTIEEMEKQQKEMEEQLKSEQNQ